MFSKIILTLAAATAVLAAPGGGSDSWGSSAGGSWGGEAECSTTCSTSLCTQSSVYEVTSAIYETKTDYIPVTNWVPSSYAVTKTLTTNEASEIVTSTPYTTVIWQPVTVTTWVEVPYTTVCEEETKVAQVTSTPTVSVCTEETTIPYTTQWVETQTTCATITASAGWGSGSSGSGSGSW